MAYSVRPGRGRPSLDYSLCDQTVTVYHYTPGSSASVTRTVYNNAFLDHTKNENVSRTGTQETNSFLLVLPCSSQVVFNGDKVLIGNGPTISAADWPTFIPANTPGLVVVKHVDLKYYGGQIVHLEAGG